MTEEPIVEQESKPELSFKEALAALARLQSKDTELDAVKQKLAAFPKAMEEKQAKLDSAKKEADLIKETANKLLLERKSLEGEVTKKEEELKKRGGETQQVKTNEAYKALLAELENIKSEKGKLEDRILENMEQGDELKRNEGKLKQEAEAKKKTVEAEVAVLETEKKQAEEAIKVLEEERRSLAASVPDEVLSRYDRVHSKRGGLALVPLLEGGSCGGCRMHFPQHVVNDLLKQKDFVTCESCQRILYIPEKK